MNNMKNISYITENMPGYEEYIIYNRKHARI